MARGLQGGGKEDLRQAGPCFPEHCSQLVIALGGSPQCHYSKEWDRSRDGGFSLSQSIWPAAGSEETQKTCVFSEKCVPGLELHVVGGFVASLSQAPSQAGCWPGALTGHRSQHK